MNAIGDVLDWAEEEWDDAVNAWKAKVAEFEEAVDMLAADKAAADATGDSAEWRTLWDRAQTVKAAVEYLAQKLGETIDWTRGVFGLQGMAAMGFLPLVPVAVIFASIAALSYFINDFAQFHSKMNYAREHGLAPKETMSFLTGGGVLDTIKGGALWVMAAGAAIYFGPMILKRLGVGK